MGKFSKSHRQCSMLVGVITRVLFVILSLAGSMWEAFNEYLLKDYVRKRLILDPSMSKVVTSK